MAELKDGGKAPNFTLESTSDSPTKLSSYKSKWVVLYFYPKDLTSGCTTEAIDFNTFITKFHKLNAEILGVSKDSLESHHKFATKYSFKFPLLADPEGEVCKAYGVWKQKSMYGRKYMGIERTTFLIKVDSKGRGKITKIYPKVKVAGHAKAVLQDLNELS
jgi:peroxiredoxin Q/BCP